MKVTTKKSKENKIALDIEVPQDAVLKRFDEVYEKIGQEAKVPGYRPGKAPRSVLEQHHAQLARQEVLKTLIAQTYQESIKEKNIDVIDMPQITEVKLEGNVLSYKAEVEIKPEIKIKQYKGLKLKKAEIKVEPSEINEYLAQLKKARGEDIPDIKLANSLGYKTQEEFLGCLEKQFYLKKENEERARLEKELIGQLLKNTSFQVPASLIENRIHELEHQAEHQLAEYGLPQEKIKERLDEFKPKFKTEAEEQVKVFLILEEIAKLENIKKDDQVINKTVEFLFMEADWN